MISKLDTNFKVVDEYASETLLRKYIPVVNSLVFTPNKFKQNVDFEKYPVFVKIVSDRAVHKVKSKAIFEIKSKSDFAKKKASILKRAKVLNAKKIIVQEKVYGYELIFGIKDDKKFGTLLLVGLGGHFAEQLKDTSLRVFPVKKSDFISMINNLKNKAITLNLDVDKLWVFASKLIKFVQSHKNIKFVDLNPVIVDYETKKPVVVDARIYIKKKEK